MPNAQSVNHSNFHRFQALTLAEHGVPVKEVADICKMSTQTIYRLKKQARERGYDPAVSRLLEEAYVIDAPRSGQPPKVTEEVEKAILDNVRKDKSGREKPSAVLGYEHGLSSTTILRVLKRNGMKSCKTTKKPGLSESMMEARYQFCLRYKDWTLEDWKNVIWTDETSIVLGVQRGRRRAVWRTSKEAQNSMNIRRRHARFSEFMFWGSFSYDKKGPFHIWKPETAKDKREAQIDIDKMNEELEEDAKTQWELEVGMRRMGLQNQGGRRPVWKWDKQHGKIVREGKGGIDWYRYQKNILLPKLIPFAEECKMERPNTIVQEDKAPSHASKHQDKVFMDANILRLLWPGNSPDLNMIEPNWIWMKRETTRRGPPTCRLIATKVWTRCWTKKLTQARIRSWIERMPRHIQKVIDLKGGNEYREGREEGEVRPYNSEERRMRYTKYQHIDSDVE